MATSNGFGVPTSFAEYFQLAGELGHTLTSADLAALGDALGEAAYRMMLAEATGRWRFRGGRHEPDHYRPGDVVALSGLHAMDLLADHRAGDQVATHPESVRVARSLLDARNYWLPPRAEQAVLTSRPPDPDLLAALRLPHTSCVIWFAEPAAIPTEAVPDVTDRIDTIHRFTASPDGYMERPAIAAFQTLHHMRTTGGGRLEGVLLTTADDGQVRDPIGWFVRHQPDTGLPTRALLFARASQAGWRTVADLLAAIIAWGDWTAPERLTTGVAWDADRAARRQLRKGRTRTLEEAGGLSNVVVLDARRRAPSRGPGPGTHASPIPHPRVGYFKPVPIGPRAEGRREPRWYPPVIVNAGKPGGDVLRVYRLPNPQH